MKEYIEERVIAIAEYIIETRNTVRAAAKEFGVSKPSYGYRLNERFWWGYKQYEYDRIC